MKINKNKRQALIAGVCGAVLIIGLFMYFTSVCHMRSVLKSNCGAGIDCECFANVMDYRLDDDQVRAFHRYVKSLKKRPTNILEFTDEVSASKISNAVAVCRPRPVVQEQQKTKGKR